MDYVRASELVRILNQKIELDGDKEVLIPRNPQTFHKEFEHSAAIPIVGVNTWLDDQDLPTEFMILDESWAEALT